MGMKPPLPRKRVDPYDLNEESEADRLAAERRFGNPRRKSPYDLNRIRIKRKRR